jgi:membrane-associated protein
VIEFFRWLIDLFLNLDVHLRGIVEQYGTWTYLILFAVIFCETGLVVTPFLPGDSLLFAAGALAGLGWLDPALLFVLLSAAAILGDTVNYWIGAYVGPRAFSGEVRFLKKEYLDRTHRFYEKYGGKTIVLARFIPIIRTFAPFVAGIGTMNYPRFLVYNVVGGMAWVATFVGVGWLSVRLADFFGGPETVQRYFPFVILAIIVVSVLPIVVEWVRCRWKGRKGAPAEPAAEGSDPAAEVLDREVWNREDD